LLRRFALLRCCSIASLFHSTPPRLLLDSACARFARLLLALGASPSWKGSLFGGPTDLIESEGP
jgi:hypothetical protein